MPIACFLVPAFGIVCEHTRRPDLAGRPLALTSDGGVLRSVSEETERFGIRAGQSSSGAKALCPAIALLPYDAEHYLEAARGIWDLLAVESSCVEPVSPEVSYAEMDGRDVPRRVRALACEIARLAKTPAQAGLGASKLVARQAALQAVSSADGESALQSPIGLIGPISLIGPIGPTQPDTTQPFVPIWNEIHYYRLT
jgi:DNA polymerase IV